MRYGRPGVDHPSARAYAADWPTAFTALAGSDGNGAPVIATTDGIALTANPTPASSPMRGPSLAS
jgi:hypothetical protein